MEDETTTPVKTIHDQLQPHALCLITDRNKRDEDRPSDILLSLITPN